MILKNIQSIAQFFLFFLLLTISTAFCEERFFIQTIGGDQAYQSKSIIATNDRGYVISGQYGNEQLETDLFVMKFDLNQTILWSLVSNLDFKACANDIFQTKDGGYIIGGIIFDSSSLSDIIIIKINKNGILEWNHRISGTRSERVYSIKQTSDEGFILTGYSSSYGMTKYGVFLLKLDNNGNLEWSTITGDDNTENVAKEVQETLDKGFIVVGYTDSYGVGERNILLLKYNNIGNLEWTKVIDGHNSEWGNFVRQTKDEGYIVVGRTKSYGAEDDDIIILRFDKTGNHEWSKIIDNNNDDDAISLSITLDQKFIIAGNTKSFNQEENYDTILIKLDEEGYVDWARIIGGKDNDTVNSLNQTNNGLMLAGETESFNLTMSNQFIVKTDQFGRIEGCEYNRTVDLKTVTINPSIMSPSPKNFSVTPQVNTISITTSTPNIYSSIQCLYVSECYTQEQIQSLISNAIVEKEEIILLKDEKINELNNTISNMYTKDQLDEAISKTLENYYSQTQVDNMINKILEWDEDNDGMIGLIEAIHALKISAGIDKVDRINGE